MDRFVLSTEIISGHDGLDYLKTLKADSVCIVSDKVMVELGAVKRITDILDSRQIDYHIFDSVEANPSLETVYEGLHHIIENKLGALIAVGGGSVIDAAKAIIYFCIKTKEILIETSKIVKPEFVAIPTTSGTGSEVTSYSVITDHEHQRKIPLSDKIMLPDVAILDPTFTMSVPKGVTADTGMDVITHALEAFVSPDGSSLSTMYAQNALKMAFSSLLKVYYNGQNRVERARMHEASCMAGVSFTNAGLGINHSLAHTLGAHFHISHGRANAILLPKVVAFNAGLTDQTFESHGAPYVKVASLLGIETDNSATSIEAFVSLIEHFNEKLEIPHALRDMGIDREEYFKAVPQMAEDALMDMCTKTNPRPVSKAELEGILYSIF
ncbi:1-propanol dehydrogenase PduQ [Fusibacter sp. JL216-2]|uniref:1-propanol dehydrogenase PduQ n=1 Tax=Fusibacter sp. JL216-2 TaxID=3071453 RepID=UPI003D34A565